METAACRFLERFWANVFKYAKPTANNNQSNYQYLSESNPGPNPPSETEIRCLTYVIKPCLTNQFQHEQKRIIRHLSEPLSDNCCGRLFWLRRYASTKLLLVAGLTPSPPPVLVCRVLL